MVTSSASLHLCLLSASSALQPDLFHRLAECAPTETRRCCRPRLGKAVSNVFRFDATVRCSVSCTLFFCLFVCLFVCFSPSSVVNLHKNTLYKRSEWHKIACEPNAAPIFKSSVHLITKMCFFPLLSDLRHADCFSSGFQMSVPLIYPFSVMWVKEMSFQCFSALKMYLKMYFSVSQMFPGRVEQLFEILL